MKFIHLARTEARCRPEKPNTILHNGCPQQDVCARRIAANTVGAPEQDFSRELQPDVGSTFFPCEHFVHQ